MRLKRKLKLKHKVEQKGRRLLNKILFAIVIILLIILLLGCLGDFAMKFDFLMQMVQQQQEQLTHQGQYIKELQLENAQMAKAFSYQHGQIQDLQQWQDAKLHIPQGSIGESNLHTYETPASEDIKEPAKLSDSFSATSLSVTIITTMVMTVKAIVSLVPSMP